MRLNILGRVMLYNGVSLINKPLSRSFIKKLVYEPDYLEVGKVKLPHFPELSVQIKGYTYCLLESYQSYIHTLANTLGIEVIDSWAFPPKELKIRRYKPYSEVVVTEYHLYVYERDTILANVLASDCSLLIRMLEGSLPEGVSLYVNVPDKKHEMARYIPDKELLDLKTELHDLEDEKKKKKK